jgi:outer membrane biogenesis lipoprotein LolB
MITNRVTVLGLPLGILMSAVLLLSGCAGKPTATAPTTPSSTVTQQQQQIQDNPNLSPQARAAAAAAYSSFANRPNTAPSH